jgi:hypothetical protein
MLITKHFGVGNTTIKKIYKKIGLNIRKNPIFINKDKKNKIENYKNQQIQGKQLKDLINECFLFKKKIKKYKSSIIINKQFKKSVKKSF